MSVLSNSGNMKQNSTNLNSKQAKRIENKKRKLSALYMISSLNEEDKKKTMIKEKVAELFGSKEDVETDFNSQKSESKKRKYDEIENDSVRGSPNLVKRNLSDAEHQQLKILIKQRLAAKKNLPKLRLKEPGIQASIDQPKEKRTPIFLSDIQHFILYSLHGHMSTGNIPRWVTLEKFTRVKNVLFLVVEGMSLLDYNKYEELCPTLKEFTYKLEVISPLAYGGCLIREIATLPLSESQRHKLEKRFGSLREASTNNRVYKVLRTMFPMEYVRKIRHESEKNAFSRTELILSPWQMLEEGYPFPLDGELKEKYADYVYTKDRYTEISSNSPMWALDCEMCMTKNGSELTRISIVNENLESVYESYVKPHNPITNYLTRFSGITAKHLENVQTRLEDVQTVLRTIMPSDVILVGHSLNMDLHSLKMLHPYCIDTSVIFNLSGERARKTKLKVLSSEILGERIQNNESGHDSIQDASACMKLVLAKLQHSLDWGDAVICGTFTVEQLLANVQRLRYERNKSVQNQVHTPTISQCQVPVVKSKAELPKYVRADQVVQNQMFTTSLFSHLVTREKYCALVAGNAVINEFIKYIPEQLRPFQPESRLQISRQKTNKAIVKYGRNKAPEHGTSLMYTTVDRTPELTARKVDQLVRKLTKNLSGNVLLAVLLAGRSTAVDEVDTTNRGLLLLKLHNEVVPPIQLEGDINKNTETPLVC